MNEEHLLKDPLFYLKKERYPVLILIINGLCEYREEPPSKNPKADLKEAAYLFRALKIKETPEIRERFCKLLNGVRALLQSQKHSTQPL